MKILESWGSDKIKKYYSGMQGDFSDYTSIHALFSSKILYIFSILSFFIGFILTVPLIYLELKFNVFNFTEANFYHIVLYAITLIFIVFLEFYLLFLLGLYTLAYYIYHLYHLNENMITAEEDFIKMLSRTVMELPESNVIKYNINHLKYTDKDIVIFTLLYKIKVVFTNFILKFIANKALVRSSFRGYSAYIAAIGTGAWDAFTFYKTIKHSQYKIMVRYTILYLIETKMNLLTEEYNTKAILSRYYHYNEYNNNLDYLLGEIYKTTAFAYSKESFLDKKVMHECNKDLLLLLFSFKEKIHSKRERRIIGELGKLEEIKNLRKAIKDGHLDYIKKFIDNIR